jgi:hypothetical protein
MAETISHGWWLDDEKLKAFEALVRADEREQALATPVQPVAWPAGLIDRIKAAEQRIQDGHAPRRIPADPTDVDLVLAEVRYLLEGKQPPFWIKTTPPAQPAPVQPVAWVERWYGSGQEKGWWIWERHSLTHGQAIAYIGTGPRAERLTSVIVEKHNNVLFPTEPVKEPFTPDVHGISGPTPPAPAQELVECQYGNGGYACCEGGPCKADEQNNAAQPAPTVQEPVAIALNTGTKQGVKWLKNVEHGVNLYTAQPASASWMEMVTANLVREGIGKHKARELAEHFYSLAQRPWVGLTDEEVMQTMSGDWTSQFYFARAIETKLRSKNNG